MKKLIQFFELQQLNKTTLVLVGLFVVCVILFVILFIDLIVSKGDEKTRYSISSLSETYTYQTVSHLSPKVLLRKYQLIKNCAASNGQWIEQQALLEFLPQSTVIITRLGNGDLQLDVQGHEFAHSGGRLNGIEFGPCARIVVSLNDEHPVFTMNLHGDITIGRNVTDASDGYFPFLLEGEIVIEEQAFLSQEIFQHSPIALYRGDYIRFEQQTVSPRGVLRARAGEEGIQAVIAVIGGNVLAESYRAQPRKVDISFVNRLANDSELAIVFSGFVIFIQLMGVVIVFLLRLKVVNNTSGMANVEI